MSKRIRGPWLVLGVMLLACGDRVAKPAVPVAEATVAAQSPPSRSATARSTPGSRRALLVGINDYSASRLGPPRAATPARGWQSLQGSVNDVEAMREMLVLRYDFAAADIVVLENQEATRDAILQALERHLERPAQTGDVLLFYYSGHGSQVPNSRSTERDRLDESLVPADSRLGAEDIRDKELRQRFNRILDRGARLTAIFDSCHSGSAARGLATGGGSRSIEPARRDAADASADGPAPETRGALIISAAQDREIARERRDDRGQPRGVFSWAWLRALRRAAAGEPAIDTFLRAQALIRAESPWQDPVLAGGAEARATPFLSTDAVTAARRSRIAVEQLRRDGTVVVQGGWAHGLSPGSELRLAGTGASYEVTEMLGLGRSVARPLTRGPAPDALAPGALLEIAGWAAPPARPLRVWMPRVASTAPLARWAEDVERAAAGRKVRWIDDPVDATPTHVLRWNRGAWELLSGGVRSRFDATAGPAEIVERLPVHSSLFVQLPAAEWLVKGIDVGPGTDRAAIEPTDDADDADYVLAGRAVRGSVEYAWVRPLVTQGDQHRTPLPLRSAWRSISSSTEVALLLQQAIVQLRRIQAWQMLEGPRESQSPYRLSIRREPGGAAVRDGVLLGEQRYALALEARPGAKATPRHVYAFLIDSAGEAILLYPRPETGSVENRFPPDGAPPAAVFPLDVTFDIAEPYGVDTYFLLTTEEPLPDPAVLTWDGVRGRGPATSALEELLVQTSSAARSARLVRTPANWSIERLTLRSVPPKGKVAS